MLLTLRIKNLALVSDLTLELAPGCNAITGETGAGKSILIGALCLVLGERADRTLIRGGSDNCSVEAVFDSRRVRAPLDDFLEENGLEPCEDGQLIIKRSFTAAGTNRQFVNGSPTTLNALKLLGDWLVDIHGPHDHQSLLHNSRQLAILDAFGGLAPRRAQFAEAVRRRRELEDRKADLIVDEQTCAQQIDLLRHQVHEISGARIEPAEEDALEQEYTRSSNAARLIELSQSALQLIGEDDASILTQTGALGRLLQELRSLDQQTEGLAEAQQQVSAILDDLQGELSAYADRIEVDPGRLNELEERLTLLQSLKRKYGPTLDDVVAFGNEVHDKLQSLERRDEEAARINAALERTDRELQKLGRELTAARTQVIPKFSRTVMAQLKDLGFAQCEFDITLQPALEGGWDGPSVKASGLDRIEFQFSPNQGEPARPLRAIASSGEMSRVMLALKTVLAAEDDVPVLVFDEIDANVGGETAAVVGSKMREIGQNRQVLCITHLAPVAAGADTHFVVTKQLVGDRTLSSIERLGNKERIEELARMLGGKSDAARKHARELLR